MRLPTQLGLWRKIPNPETSLRSYSKNQYTSSWCSGCSPEGLPVALFTFPTVRGSAAPELTELDVSVQQTEYPIKPPLKSDG